MSGHSAPSDRKAAFTGLILGVIALAVVVITISKLTSRKFEKHEAAKPTASALR